NLRGHRQTAAAPSDPGSRLEEGIVDAEELHHDTCPDPPYSAVAGRSVGRRDNLVGPPGRGRGHTACRNGRRRSPRGLPRRVQGPDAPPLHELPPVRRVTAPG